MYAEEDRLLLSGIQHFAFCKRQWALIHLEQQWQENLRTVEGQLLHERAHEAGAEKRGDVIITRGMPVFSNTLGIQGVCDVVEFHQDEQNGVPIAGREGRYLPVPVEYKRGSPKEGDEDILQLCAQAMCLSEMLVCPVPEGALFYGETRRRLNVVFEEALLKRLRDMFLEMHQLFSRGHTPLVKKGKACQSCSLKDLCLPRLVRHENASAYLASRLKEADTL